MAISNFRWDIEQQTLFEIHRILTYAKIPNLCMNLC